MCAAICDMDMWLYPYRSLAQLMRWRHSIYCGTFYNCVSHLLCIFVGGGKLQHTRTKQFTILLPKNEDQKEQEAAQKESWEPSS